ncbi:Major facilitator superfamily domain-containing protein 4A [Collichthys lucidus]|uniref:Major facilitator superfamily domain-containing protein 4A n=1 Tax=Collichthys lucidus TaxID=240159 RepID=A0A4U5UAU8_COLLU|nr:Major facilitator superfamily domain-containing protein 4A [Collichthys lucidus]
MKLLDERILSLFKRHWRQTLTYWSVFFSFGLCIAFLGPTILDLRCQTQSTLQQITWVFFSQQFFLLVGSGLGGRFKKTLLSSLSALLFCTLVISLVFAIIPLCHHIVLLSVAMALAGKAMGVIDTIANLQLALHFFIGLGALVSPLVADPFLAEDNCVLSVNWTANSSSSSDLHHLRSSMVHGHGAGLHNISQYPLHTEGIVITRVSYAFWIMALINGSYAGFVYTYAVSPPLLMGHKTAGCLDSTFWASITVGRLAFIYLSYRYTAPKLLSFCLVGVIIVQCLLLIFYNSCVFLFIGTCILGLCISSVFPSMLAFTEDVLDYKGCATTVLVTSASTGEMMLQLLVGSVMHSQGSYAFLVCCTIASFIAFSLFLLFLYIQHIHSNYPTSDHTSDSSKSIDMEEKPDKTGGS